MPTDTASRFEQFLIPEPNSGCWLWLGNLGSAGYGNFSIGGKAHRANRASWLLYRGSLKDSREYVCHRCDNRYCVNPDHLFLGDAKLNTADMVKKGRGVWLNGEQSPNCKLTDESVLAIMNDERSQRVIAAHHKISVAIVHGIKAGTRWRHITNGTKTQKRGKRGIDNGRAKLTENQVRLIRIDYRSGPEIARQYNITRHSVSLIKKRRSWRHVD